MSGPLVFVHRGSSAALPEHNLAACLRALGEGADGLAYDVRLVLPAGVDGIGTVRPALALARRG